MENSIKRITITYIFMYSVSTIKLKLLNLKNFLENIKNENSTSI